MAHKLVQDLQTRLNTAFSISIWSISACQISSSVGKILIKLSDDDDPSPKYEHNARLACDWWICWFSWPLLILTFALSSSFSTHCFSSTLGVTRKLIFYGPSYFDLKLEGIYWIINLFLLKLIFGCFSGFYGQCSVTVAWTNPRPWRIKVRKL